MPLDRFPHPPLLPSVCPLFNGRMASLLAASQVVSRAEMYRRSQPCDILLTITPDYFLHDPFRKVCNKIFRLVLATPYTSSKIYLGNDVLAGFGLNAAGGKSAIRGVSYRKYLSLLKNACLLRVPGLTGSQQSSILRFVGQRFGAKFDLKLIIKSFWRRVACKLKGDVEKAGSRSPCGLKKVEIPFHTCSTIISAAFFQAGIDFQPDPALVWPIDFFLSPRTTIVCRLQR